MNVAIDPKFSQNESSVFARTAIRSMDTGAAGAQVVNRTHRVVRARALAMQEQRSRARSLMLPLIICSVLLILTVLAVWTGLYQYQVVEAAEAVEADVSALAATEMNNHMLVSLLWFVPVTVALLATVWVRRSRNGPDNEAL
jgi:cytochrome bd-type quinol oxidase subunit 2